MELHVIGAQIARLRKEGGYRQEDIARAVGVSTQAVSKWERGGVPDTELLPAIASFFGVSIDSLFGRSVADDKGLQSALMKRVSETPQEEQIKRVFDFCWDMERAMMHSADHSSIEDFKGSISEVDQRYSSVRYNNGFTEMGIANRLQYFFISPDAEHVESALLEGIDYIGLFHHLSDKDFFDTLVFLSKRDGYHAFTSALLEKHIGVTREKAECMLSILLQYALVFQTQIEMDDELKTVYTFRHTPSFKALLIFAREMICTPTKFSHFSDQRDRGYLG